MAFIIGEIRAFAFGSLGSIEGENTYPAMRAQGWLECDGSSLPKAGFPALFRAIGYNWGSEDKPNSFKIPDLRGYFARGWDHGAGRDPNAAQREGIHLADAPNDFVGATGDTVGSVQRDELARHMHQYDAARPFGAGAGDHDRAKSGGRAATTSGTGGDETRPKNAYVMYCIYTGRKIPAGAKLTYLPAEESE
jgi:microcystin-dependent protein